MLQAPGAAREASRRQMGAIPAQLVHGAARWEQSHRPRASLVQQAAGAISLLWQHCLSAQVAQLALGVTCRVQLRRMCAMNVRLASGARR